MVRLLVNVLCLYGKLVYHSTLTCTDDALTTMQVVFSKRLSSSNFSYIGRFEPTVFRMGMVEIVV